MSSPTTTTTTANPETVVTEKAARAAHDAVDRFADRAAQAERTLRDTAAASTDKVQAGTERAREQLDTTVKSVDTFVRENPLASAGIAFAAGALLSTLLRK